MIRKDKRKDKSNHPWRLLLLSFSLQRPYIKLKETKISDGNTISK